jgi:hypothetical protein
MTTDEYGGKRCSYCTQALANSLYIPVSLKQTKMKYEVPGLIKPLLDYLDKVRNCVFQPEDWQRHRHQTML